jgi:hypothetical protein
MRLPRSSQQDGAGDGSPMKVVRVNQRQKDDCAICTAAMALSYSYERVLEDRRRRYSPFDDKDSWWEWYFQDEGRRVAYLPLQERDVTQAHDSNVLGVLGLTHPRLSVGHVVVMDEVGVVDPSDGFPEHLAFVKWKALKLA